MTLYSISGVVPYNKLKTLKLSEVNGAIKNHMKRTHPDCEQVQSDFFDDDIVVIFENDGIYYKLDIEA